MAYPTLNRRLLDVLDKDPHLPAQIYKHEGRWATITRGEFLRRIAGLSIALAELGVKPGDRVGLFSGNRPEWHVADFAALGLGAINVPIYFNEAAERIVYILNHSGAKVVVAAGAAQAAHLISVREELKTVEQIIVADAAKDLPGEYLRYEPLIATAGEKDIAAYRLRATELAPDQLATLIYTSGTTGEPKGVMLTHVNLSSNSLDSCVPVDLQPGKDVALSFLPLAHVYERMLDYVYIFQGIPVAYVETMDTIAQAMLEIRPTIFAGVPRVFEKLYARIMEKGHQARGPKRKLFDWAIGVAGNSIPWRAYGRPAPPALRFKWSIANRLVFSKIRAGMGGRTRIIFSGGAPLSKELAEFFWAIGLPIYQGYGLTETSPIVTSNYPVNRVGSVGRAIPNVEIRIAEDGEILVQGPCVMQGYYLRADETRAALSPGGWLHTGDIGYIDADGFVFVTDRKKDLLKTAAGKYIAPQPIENALKTSPFILNAAVVGDKRKFASALIVPNFAVVSAAARDQGLTLPSSREIAASPWVRQLIEKEIHRVTPGLAQYETIKRFALLPEDFSFDNGSLTYTLKLKRRVIAERYRDVIEGLYADVEERVPHS
jgi:long-chain acyl-CoA synthetase